MLQKGEVKEDRETAGGLTMNQYIITEELLQEAMENTTWGRTNQQKFRDKLTPYQSERDKVLDELELWRNHLVYCMGMYYTADDYIKAWIAEDSKLKELRQAGES